MKQYLLRLCLLPAILLFATSGAVRTKTEVHTQYLPILRSPIPMPTVELRAVWVTRFDWTTPDAPVAPSKIDEIVQNVADARFNAIFFQVRATADAYYDSPLEPWAARVAGALGQPPDPLWDPLTYLIDRAHAKGIQVHAYINVYPVSGCTAPDAAVWPVPLYHQLIDAHGSSDDKPNGLQWRQNGDLSCETYLRASPASAFFNDHVIAVGHDLMTRYPLDGLHLDHVRYAGESTSCDPVSEAAFGAPCFSSPDYATWQRDQISQLVRRYYEEVVPLRNGAWLSAAVWPIYELDPSWGWPGRPLQGNIHLYQDSKGWLDDGIVDAISPMIYPGSMNCPDNSFWTMARWETLVRDFRADRNGRFLIPGIGTGYCSFDEIERRIILARNIGTNGHALFSYTGLAANAYFDKLARGVYREAAVPPQIER